jgi:hypothetical protein
MPKYPNANAIEFAVLHLLEGTLPHAQPQRRGIVKFGNIRDVEQQVRVRIKRTMGFHAFEHINGGEDG